MSAPARKPSHDHEEPEFDGSRLRRLRLARGMSMDDLSERLGNLSKQMISRYESGRSSPPPKVLDRLCEVFGVWREFFQQNQAVSIHIEGFRDTSGVPEMQRQYIARREASSRSSSKEPDDNKFGSVRDGELKLRKTDEVSVQIDLDKDLRPKLQAEISAQLEFALEARLKLNLLSSGRELLSPRLPDVEPAITPVEIDLAAERLREFWGVERKPIKSVRNLLEANNIMVFELYLPSKVDGFAFHFRRQQSFGAGIAVRSGLPGDRLRFSMLHEVAHLYCLSGDGEYDNLERRANMFASAMLLPKEVLYDFCRSIGPQIRLDDLLPLKAEFGISVASIILRGRTLGLLSQTQCERLYSEIDARGWRKNEPVRIEPELPDLVRAQVERLFEAGLLSERERDWITSTDAALVTKDTSLSWQDILMESPEQQHLVVRRLVSARKASYWRDPFDTGKPGPS
jgi:Zn-dependent peptidase ImmA (M78 family)/transcriptional regulator with XRE-family HTH domain